MRRRVIVAVVAGLLLSPAASAFAQQQAAIIGVVNDATKAVLPGATVTATNLATGTLASSVSDERGEYRVLNLVPGRYKLQGTAKVSLMAEVFNLFNHRNYTGYFNQLNPTNAATTARFGLPSAASVPRQGHLAFRFAR